LNGRPWSADDTATLKRMNAAGFDDTQIADRMGFCAKTIRRRRQALGLSSYITVRYGNWGSLTADARRAISVLAT
jgi:hypothetical protein